MATENHHVNSRQSCENTCRAVWAFWTKNKNINVSLSTKRSLDQNALVNQWYTDIAHCCQDSFLNIRRQCKLNYGVPILSRDDIYRERVFNSLKKSFPYDKLLEIMDIFSVTSVMSTEQLKEYLNQMHEDHPYLEAKKKIDY